MLAGSILAVLAAGMVPIHAADYFTHLAMGRYIAEHGIPTTEPFLYTCQGRELIAFEWLAGVLFYRGYQLFGHVGMQLAKATLTVAIFMLVYATARRRGAPTALAAVIMLWAVLAGQHRLMLRPHLLSWLLVTVVYYILHLDWSPRRILPVLLASSVLLTNLHGSAMLAAALVGLFGLDRLLAPGAATPGRSRGYGLVLLGGSALMLAASAINPYGLKLLTYPLRPIDAPDVRSVVQEWRPMPWMLDRWPYWSLAAAVLAGPLACWATCRKRPSLVELLLPLGLVPASIVMRRFSLLMAMLCAPLLAGQVSAILGRLTSGGQQRAWQGLAPAAVWGAALAAAAAMLAVGPQVRRPGWGLKSELLPVKAVAFIAAQPHLRGPMFNNYEFGGYIHWKLFPLGCQAFIDGRTWDYPRRLFDDYGHIQNRRPGWSARLDAYGAVIRLERWRPQIFQPEKDRYEQPGWKIIYWDDHDVVLVRDLPRFRPIVARYECSATFPPILARRMGRISRSPADIRQAERLREQLAAKLARQPDSITARAALGQMLAELGHYDQAVAELRGALAADPLLHSAWARLCWVHLVFSRPDRAVQAARRYLQQTGNVRQRRKALRLLAESARAAGDHRGFADALREYLRCGPPDEWSAAMQANR
ncbi:MAG: tetratricopeptide repeat protein [Phycisphaerae bacterium]